MEQETFSEPKYAPVNSVSSYTSENLGQLAMFL